MEFEIVTRNDIQISGLQTELTRSQSNNYKIIKENWQSFNYELRIKNIHLGENWERVGDARKSGGRF